MSKVIGITQRTSPEHVVVKVWNYGADGVPDNMNVYHDVTRSSLIRAQRMQLKLFDAMKGQSPDAT